MNSEKLHPEQMILVSHSIRHAAHFLLGRAGEWAVSKDVASSTDSFVSESGVLRDLASLEPGSLRANGFNEWFDSIVYVHALVGSPSGANCLRVS